MLVSSTHFRVFEKFEMKEKKMKLSLNDVYDDFNQIFSISAIIDAGY